MQQFGEFTRHTPATTEIIARSRNGRTIFLKDEKGNDTKTPVAYDGRSIAFLRDKDGNDWYDVRHKFNQYDTLKVGYAQDGRVQHFTTNIDRFFPVGLSVVELEATEENMKVSLGADWFYLDGKLQQIINHAERAETERSRLMREATSRIDWLTAAAEDGDINDEEKAELAGLRAYRTELRRLDITAAPGITFPTLPTK